MDGLEAKLQSLQKQRAAERCRTPAGPRLELSGPCWVANARGRRSQSEFFTAQKGNVQQNHILVPVHDPLDLRRRVFLYARWGHSPRWLKNDINIY